MLTKRSFARLLKGVLGEKLYADLRRRSLAFRSNRRAFTEIYERHLWGCSESVSGVGSTLEGSRSIGNVLPQLLHDLGAQSLIDAGCGDFNWMRTVELPGIKYIGVDVVRISSNAIGGLMVAKIVASWSPTSQRTGCGRRCRLVPPLPDSSDEQTSLDGLEEFQTKRHWLLDNNEFPQPR